MSRSRIPWPSRFSLRFNTILAAGLWVECSILAVRDWTLILAPLIFTAVVVFQWWACRKVYCTEPVRPRPDYAAIARMEREVWGEAFRHEGAPAVVKPLYGISMAEFGENMAGFGWQMCAKHDRAQRWDGRTTHPDTTQPASVEDYVLWLQGYVRRGGKPTHFYDYPFGQVGFRYADSRLTVDSDYEYGSSLRRIIVAKNVTTERTNPAGPFGGWAHTKCYFMHGFRTNDSSVPVYSDPEFDQFRHYR